MVFAGSGLTMWNEKISTNRYYTLPRKFLTGVTILGSGCIFLLSCLSIGWWKTKRLSAFKSAVNLFTDRVKSSRAKRNPLYDLYFPPGCTVGSNVQKALLFYPELLVDHTAYAPIISKMTDAGILVVVANLEPLRTPTRFTGVSKKEAENILFEVGTLLGIQIEEWIIGGHGQGAVSASELVGVIPTISRFFIWGSMQCRNLSKSNFSVLVVNATNDNIARMLQTEESFKKKLPSKTTYYAIQGGNHSGFGHYGPQLFPTKENDRSITIDEQQKQCVEQTLDFILQHEQSVKKED